MRDIDQIIALVKQRIPTADIRQLEVTHPGADDDGLWFFTVPHAPMIAGRRKEIQLQSSNGACPFIVEHHDMESSTDAESAHSIAEAVEKVCSYLTKLSPILKRDRYDPENLLRQLDDQKPAMGVNEWCYRFQCAGDDIDDFLAYIPDDPAQHEMARTHLREFITQIHDIDNAVQASFDAEYRASGLDLSNFKLQIGWLRITDQTIVVRYWGTVVNTEWETTLVKAYGRWIEYPYRYDGKVSLAPDS